MNNNISVISEKWNTIIDEYDNLFKGYNLKKRFISCLKEGASDEEIRQAEKIIGISFPKELAELYKCNNGNIETSNEAIFLGGILGLDFLCIEEVVEEWEAWRELDDEDLDEFSTSTPEKAIKCTYTNKGWIPFAADGGGNFIGIDMEPDVNGIAGQVINFGRDEDNKYVLAENLSQFLDLMIDIIRSDDFKIEFMDDENKQPAFMFVNNDKPKFPTDYIISLLYKN